ncbi:sodium-independent anion transporter [Sphingopyxis sp. BSNA05]|uniref:SulP family inorganic anion transporter n=1 Tax=Sphingopyxis sp. BSNA05 TaxID=1236614 RepID=UPI001564CA44|nr:SulP family inorganic anion transporter [Sphingopyxis sp. BSNA05]NRD88409.1 sodium-independent anion transporter [Sphingopyxis sp. BSNA05]
MNSFTPKIFTTMREGYDFGLFKADAVAGLTVAIVALPLSMALAIASGASPDKGLVTAVIAGFLISFLGGSRVQVGGPTGAFVVVVFNVIAQHGYDGLLIATFMAGLILIAAGAFKIGRLIKFIPHPVVTGFTAGIAVIIASSQVKDFLGLSLETVPSEFLPKWQAYFGAMSTVHMATLLIGLGAFCVIIALKRYAPKLPGFLIALVLASIVVALLKLPVDTIGTRFPDMPVTLPMPSLPVVTWARVAELLPSAFTIAFLAGIEALLSAVVADGMTGTRHRSNQELIGQGVANLGSVAFGGLPATGAIARTATNIKAGAKTPVAGMMHALFILLFILLGSSLMAFVPMAALAAILFVVAWGMCEIDRFIALLRMPNSDRAVLLLTFGLTILVDLTVAIGVGVTLASLLFMARMSETVQLENGNGPDPDDDADDLSQRDDLPSGVEVFRISGPVFFGVAGELLDAMRKIGRTPKVIILRMRLVPMLDASGVTMIEEFIEQARVSGAKIILSGVQAQPREMLGRIGLVNDDLAGVYFEDDYAAALRLAEQLTMITIH